MQRVRDSVLPLTFAATAACNKRDSNTDWAPVDWETAAAGMLPSSSLTATWTPPLLMGTCNLRHCLV